MINILVLSEKEDEMKKKVSLSCLCMLLFCFGLFFAGTVKAEAAETVVKGSYTYFAEDGTVYRMHNSSGKIKKVVKIKRSNTVEIIAVKGDWLYLTLDDYFCLRGTDGSWPYIYRVKTNGKGLKNLGKGGVPCVYGNYIYYNRLDFKRSFTPNTKSRGIYRMKLNGSGKRKICTTEICNWIKVYNKRIYFVDRTGSQNRVNSVNLKGKDRRTDFSGILYGKPYFKNNEMYVSTSYNYGVYNMYKINLKTKASTSLGSGAILAGYQNELYYYTGKFGAQTLYRYQISTGTKSKVCTRKTFRNVIGGKKWLIINYYRGNLRKNIGVDRIRKNGKSRKTITTYFRS